MSAKRYSPEAWEDGCTGSERVRVEAMLTGRGSRGGLTPLFRALS